MKGSKKVFAQKLCEHNPGIPNEDVASELIDTFYIVMRKMLLKENELLLEGIGKIEVKRFKGAERKRDARTGIYHKIAPRRVLKFKVADGIKKILNIDRPKSEAVE